MSHKHAPLIGITLRSVTVETEETGHPPAWNMYAQAVASAGGLPVLLPTNLAFPTLEKLLSRIDAVLLSGGGDLEPSRFGEASLGPVRQADALRDEAELGLARWLIEQGLPFLGICRGLQVMNVALGGDLIQDIAMQMPTALDHDQGKCPDQAVHSVSLATAIVTHSFSPRVA